MESNGSAAIELKDPGDLTVWLKLLILLYADDTVIFSTNQHDLQNNLNIFNDYCKIWHLNINVNKTKVVVFRARSLQNYSFKIGTQSLEVTNKYHYLGLKLLRTMALSLMLANISPNRQIKLCTICTLEFRMPIFHSTYP